ncbi:MAG: type II toxin-antitoxin system RelE/ParE family toxin [Ginsengibacter sp.]
MEVIIGKQYLKDLRKVPKYVLIAADAVIDKLKSAENLNKSGVDYTKMEGQKKNENYYRIRVGEWRIGVVLKTPSIIILTILSRGEIYKKFPPQ